MTVSVRSHHERDKAIRAGAAAARAGVHRRSNPFPLAEEDWLNWMDGYDQQTVWSEQGRGIYDPFPEDAPDVQASTPMVAGVNQAFQPDTSDNIESGL